MPENSTRITDGKFTRSTGNKIRRCPIGKYKQVLLILAALLCTTSCATAEVPSSSPNPGIPIILVHGFGGWGRESLGGLDYWGGFEDLEAILRQRGYNVMTAEVGPFSSDWDRACELYANIKGGTVYYGAAHSARYGHRRFGREYSGLYPQWSEENPVAIIGHSMGGTTARLLAHLVRNGNQAEREYANHSPLFASGPQSIKAVVTISSPHNGTSLISSDGAVDSLIDAVTATLNGLAGSRLLPGYDLRLDHWGLSRTDDESLVDYIERVRDSEFWREGNPDSAISGLAIESMTRFNSEYPADPEVAYISWATSASFSGPVTNYHYPQVSMQALFLTPSLFLGRFEPRTGEIAPEQWWENDGVVNSISMQGPILGSDDSIRPLNGAPLAGVWNFAGTLESTDHADVIGIPFWGPLAGGEFETAADFYEHLCRMIIDF